jgi:hypothetical protein
VPRPVPGKFGLFEADLDPGTPEPSGCTRGAAGATLPDFSSAARGTLRCAVEFDGGLNTALMKLRSASHKGYRVHRRRAHSDAPDENAQSVGWCPLLQWFPFAGVVADGKRLRFTQMEPSQRTDSMWEISLKGGSPRRVLPEGEHGPHEGSGTWLDGGKYFVRAWIFAPAWRWIRTRVCG